MSGELLRTGRKVGRTIYVQHGLAPSLDDPLIGIMDTPELAARVVEAVNAAAPVAKDRRLDDLYAQAEAWVNENVASRKAHPDSPTHSARRVALEEAANTVLNVVEGRLTGLAEHYARQAAPVAREDTEPKAVRQLREAIEYHADGFPRVASHIQDRLDVVQAEVDRLRPKSTAPDAQSAAPTRDALVECGRSDEETCSAEHEHIDHRVGHTASAERARDPELHERVALAFRWAYAVTVRSVGGAYRTDIEWRQPSRTEAERMADVALGVLRGGGADGSGEDEDPNLAHRAAIDTAKLSGPDTRSLLLCARDGRVGGAATIGDSRLNASIVWAMLGNGGTPEDVHRSYPWCSVEDAAVLDRLRRDVTEHVDEDDLTRLATAAGVSPDSEDVVGAIEAAIRAGREPEVVNGAEAASLPDNTLLVPCTMGGKPALGHHVRIVQDGAVKMPIPAGHEWLHFLVHRPTPAPAPLTVGEVVEDPADLDRRATVGTIVEDVDGKLGKRMPETQLEGSNKPGRWTSDADWAAGEDLEVILDFPVTIVRVGTGGGES